MAKLNPVENKDHAAEAVLSKAEAIELIQFLATELQTDSETITVPLFNTEPPKE